jgi:hypothetical protein
LVSKNEELVEGKAGWRRDLRDKRREPVNAVGDLVDFGSHKSLRDAAGTVSLCMRPMSKTKGSLRMSLNHAPDFMAAMAPVVEGVWK